MREVRGEVAAFKIMKHTKVMSTPNS